jgi:hypothetical protein
LLEPTRNLFCSDIGEAQSVDQPLFHRQPEYARARIPRLRARRDCAQLHEAKAEFWPDGHPLGVLVETGGKSNRVGKSQAEKLLLQRGKIAPRKRFHERSHRGLRHHPERKMMDPFRIAREK